MDPTTDASLARLGVFSGLLAALAALERLWPGPNPPPRRWPAHVALIALDTLQAVTPQPLRERGLRVGDMFGHGIDDRRDRVVGRDIVRGVGRRGPSVYGALRPTKKISPK